MPNYCHLKYLWKCIPYHWMGNGRNDLSLEMIWCSWCWRLYDQGCRGPKRPRICAGTARWPRRFFCQIQFKCSTLCRCSLSFHFQRWSQWRAVLRHFRTRSGFGLNLIEFGLVTNCCHWLVLLWYSSINWSDWMSTHQSRPNRGPITRDYSTNSW